MNIVSISTLTKKQIREFDCGNNDLNIFFRCFASKNDATNIGKTHVIINEDRALGFVTLCSASIEQKNFSGNLNAKLPKYPIPCIKIARLAVDKKYQKKGIGSKLLLFSFLKAIEVSENIGVYFILVDAKKDSKNFYEQYGFKRILESELTYFLAIESLKQNK